jgi:hypothetical protein
MKHNTTSKVFLGASILLIFLLSVMNVESQTTFQSQHENNSAVAPAGYTPSQQTPESNILASGNTDVLLIQTALPWNSNANTEVLTSLGYSYDIVDMSNLGTVNLFSYPVILIVNDQNQAFYDEYANQVSDFETYVESGGVLVFFAAGAGWAGGQLNAPLPGGVSWEFGYDPTNHIVDDGHPIVTGLLSGGNDEWGGPLTDADLVGNYCSHGYFTNLPADAHVILANDLWGEPTLVEYSLGNGKVIASTLTWEAYWAWYPGLGGSFAKKALDDVFLYAFSGGGTIIIGDVQVDLRVEDAPDSVRVKKSGGSYVDVVARVSGREAYTVTLTLESHASLFATPVKTFTRDRADNRGYGQVNQYQIIEPGVTQINTTLVARPFSPTPEYNKEVVWRFLVPEGVSAQLGIPFDITITAPDLFIPVNSDRVRIDIIKWGRGMAVTDRQRLYDAYGTDKVSNLLEEVYRSVDQVHGEVFYLDRYDVTWSYATNIAALNDAAEAIDNKIEQWYHQLEDAGRKPSYLMIVGGDNIVPFYRMKDSDYQPCWIPGWVPGDIGTCERDGYGSYANTSHPIGFSYHSNYFLSDNIYGNVGGSKSDWEKGKLELAVGRIVGSNAEAMLRLMVNGSNVSKVSEAGFAVIPHISYRGIKTALDGRDIDEHGFENPNIVGNDNWSRADFLTVWETNSQFYYAGVHSTPFSMSPVIDGSEEQQILSEHLTLGQISDNNPLFSVWSCNLAIPVEGSILYRMVNLGIGGFTGSTGLAQASSLGTVGAETLVNLYGEKLFPSNRIVSTHFGAALMQAKRDFPPSGPFGPPVGLYYTGRDKKAILEYVFYGVPWGRVEINAPVMTMYQGFENNTSQLEMASESVYTQIIHTQVQSYTLSSINGYDLLEIPGTTIIQDEGTPSIPIIMHTVNLPLGSSIESLALISENEVDLGVRNVPHIIPFTTYDTEPIFQDVYGITGVYPNPRYAYEVISYDDHTAVRVVIALAQYDVDSSNLVLFEDTQLQLTYDTPVSALLEGVTLVKDSFVGSENVVGSAQIQNVVGDARTFTAEFVVYDMLDAVQAIQVYPDFSVAAGETFTLDIDWVNTLPGGHYYTTVNLYESGALIGSQNASFRVLTGEVTYFNAPASLALDEYGSFSVGFANHTASSTNVAAEITVYDEEGIPVTKLLTQNANAAPFSTVDFNWSWLPGSLDSGIYIVRAKVTADGEHYSPSGRVLMLGNVYGATGALISPHAQEGDRGTEVMYQVQLENTGNVTDTYTLDLVGNEWDTSTLPVVTVTLAPNQLTTVDIVVSIPDEGVQIGDIDTVVFTVTSQATDEVIFNRTFETRVSGYVIWLPVIRR